MAERKFPFGARARTAAPANLHEQMLDRLPEAGHSSDPTGVQRFNEIRQCQLTCANLALPFHPSFPDWRLGPQFENRLPSVTLHYHQWILDLLQLADRSSEPMRSEAEQISRNMLENWLDQCGDWNDETRHLAWNSYAIATRLGVWVRLLQLPITRAPSWTDLRAALLASLWRQADHLHRHIEWDLRANHLFRDALGLAWAARFLQAPEASDWRETARRIADQQIDEQVYPDGTHFERSPMYHLEMMHDIQSCAVLLNDPEFTALALSKLVKMTEAIRWMTHPDGSTVQWNDGRRCRPERELAKQPRSNRRPRGGRWLGDAGWAVWRSDTWSLFFNLGNMGPSCQPGHAHADTLSVECSFQGQRLFVDPGNYHYDANPRRERERSTAAHNTIAVDGADSSEVWHIFRVGRRAQVSQVQVLIDQQQMQASGQHHGYAHRSEQPIHRRSVHCGHGSRLIIEDYVHGSQAKSSSARQIVGGWLLEPGWRAETTPTGWRLAHKHTEDVEVHVDATQRLSLSVEPATVCPDYHLEQPTLRLVWKYQGCLPLSVKTCLSTAHISTSQADAVSHQMQAQQNTALSRHPHEAPRAHSSDRR